MPFAVINGIRLHYRIDGIEHRDAPWLVLANALGADLTMWAPQIAAFSSRFRVLRFDTRGLGCSDVPPGPYTVGQWCADVLGLLDAFSIERAHFCGISMGGLIGVALAARHGARIDRVVLAHTAARLGTEQVWRSRAQQAREQGTRSLADATLQRWFSSAFAAREPLVHAAIRDAFAHMDSEGYASNCEAIGATDLRAETSAIHAPALVITGRADPSVPPGDSRALAQAIEGVRFVELDAQHLSNIERADEFTRTVLDFLSTPG
ncbi:3-oxoadipate enol-lactonase [Trinickia diaoshuihuensis]|uniref:3-oxoadipate enol-lactonase n=1 Tax=Trinickia diaoshuihuensis TaxID=2292265 RepID=UPI000E23ECDF|nr:3-oxoadipate enol-lactonase [Trinickia diaoshuihuensis]